jgi:hypothetical protein
MNISIFGCSFSRGVEPIDKAKSWPYYLAKLLPNCNIYNYAVSGSSIEFSIDTFKKESEDRKEITIVQLTTPARIDIWDSIHFRREHMEKNNNYHYFKQEPDGTTIGIESCHVYNLPKKHKRWYIDTFMGGVSMHEVTTECCKYFAMNEATLCFQHLHKINGVPSIEKHFDNFETLIKDRGSHFGKDGNIQVAEWVYQRIKHEL